MLLCPSDTWAGVKVFTNPQRAVPFSSQSSVSQVPWHKQEPSPDAAPSFHQDLSLVCRETETQRKMPQESAVCTIPGWGGDVTQRGTDSSALPSGDQTLLWHCCEPRPGEMGSVAKPAPSFSHDSWKTVFSCLTRKTLPCAYLSSYPHYISAVEQSGGTEDSSKAQWMLIPATNQSSWTGKFFANQLVPPDFSRLILHMKRQFLFLTIFVNSSGSSNRQVPPQSKDCPEFICTCSQIWKSSENRFACEFFQELLDFELNRC